ncbi:hypothetical protein F511_18423 [Dorcoceras hygrometricum]|uniref:C2 NT-type domain-containing protein n=1 Tax=Dorcoceras hygrometricum TaxID=472368 RepID=A0A2Z7C5T9_9LAMI|nr:hypothetical protein F511_18423 [Dorcoceras hygrometricum]
MVLGLRTNTRKGPSVQLDYIIHIQEIKPWPPSQSLRNLRGVLIQWEHGERNSGLTNQVVPFLDTGGDVGDGRIQFNESFKLHFSLSREMSAKGGDGDTFQKNCIEFSLYEPRRDKTVKGQLLATAVLDLADYGILKESLSISVPINCKRTYRNTIQPLLFLQIQPFEKSRTSSSSKDSLMTEASMDRNHVECVSTLMREEYAEEAEVASYTTDDDVSSHSSQAITSSAAESNGSLSPQHKEDMAVAENGSAPEANNDNSPDCFVEKLDEKQVSEANVSSTGNSSRSSSIDLSSDLAWISKKIISRSLQPLAAEAKVQKQSSNTEDDENDTGVGIIPENTVDGGRDEAQQPSSDEGVFTSSIAQENVADLDNRTNITLDSTLNHSHADVDASPSQGDMHEGERTNSTQGQNGPAGNETRENNQDYAIKRIGYEKEQQIDDGPLIGSSQIDVQKQVKLFENGQVSGSEENTAFFSDLSTSDRSKQVKSVRSSPDSNRRNGSVRSSEHKDTRLHTMETKNLLSDSVVQHLENRIKNLEGELREAAAIEISLYSVVAEHGSSTTKVHAPARRLSRLYFHARRQNPNSRRGIAAKSIVSGLVLVAKACGNDVPRLTFWLSNSIVLRIIMRKSLVASQLPINVRPVTETVKDRYGKKKALPLKWESFPTRGMRSGAEQIFGDWDNPLAFVAALEKVEMWIFSRIIESIWWQTFTPHMQSGAAKSINRSTDSDSSKLHRTTSSSSEHQQGSFSLELWKKAFRDACERICPVRAGGHDCGCLPLLSRLIMEQLIARLDVAMFNAILRESADEIPTDPVADPISDPDVLPIPAGKASFGAGAQLKNAIGHWSRWLTDLFGIDDDEVPGNESGSETDDDDEQRSPDMTSKSFHLLNALSDLMMLPKDMLLSRTIRKEVCPTFGPPMIRRVLNCFIPDEFCPDPIPGVVLEALNSGDSFDAEEDSIMTFPCAAAPVVYEPPSASCVAGFSGESGIHPLLTRSGSSLLKKSQTSDDELDELDSPLKSIQLDFSQPSPSSVNPTWISNKSGSINAIRYRLLREVWMNSE